MQRGRKGSGSGNPKVQPTSVGYVDIPGVQPEPPEELSPDEAKEWRRLLAVAPYNWFPREVWPLLIQLCRHIVTGRWLGESLQEVRAGLLDPKDAEQIKHLNTLCILHEREGRAITALMEKLRLTTQQRIARDVAAPQQAEQAPEIQPWTTHQ